ncbi:hypothetical protein T08_2352 [Trichinella sp. T8]|nr:hypothetical protein T08_2352 [Trichinella sp. T8]
MTCNSRLAGVRDLSHTAYSPFTKDYPVTLRQSYSPHLYLDEAAFYPHCLQTRRDSASAFCCSRPGRWTTLKSNYARRFNQRATCPSDLRKFSSHLKELRKLASPSASRSNPSPPVRASGWRTRLPPAGSAPLAAIALPQWCPRWHPHPTGKGGRNLGGPFGHSAVLDKARLPEVSLTVRDGFLVPPEARLLRAEHSAPSTRAHSHAPRSPLSVSGLSPPVHHVVLPKDSVHPGASDAGACGLGRFADNPDPRAARHGHLPSLPVHHLDELIEEVRT